MEKISQIIPSSARVTAVDMKGERPVRASAPSFGAPVSESTNRGPVKHAVDEAGKAFNEVYGADAKMAKETEIAKRMTENFFVNQGHGHKAAKESSVNLPSAGMEEVAVPLETEPDEIQAMEPEAAPQKQIANRGSFSVRV